MSVPPKLVSLAKISETMLIDIFDTLAVQPDNKLIVDTLTMLTVDKNGHPRCSQDVDKLLHEYDLGVFYKTRWFGLSLNTKVDIIRKIIHKALGYVQTPNSRDIVPHVDVVNIVNFLVDEFYVPIVVEFYLDDLYAITNNLLYNFKGACQWLVDNTVDRDRKPYASGYYVNQNLLKCGWVLLRLYYKDLGTDVDTKIIEQALTPGTQLYSFVLQSPQEYSSVADVTTFARLFTQNFFPK
jgi:hypothetical protein